MTDPVVRCVLGDLPARDLGICYAHEHVFVTGGFLATIDEQFLLDDPTVACAELMEAKAAGLSAMVDATPSTFGRDIVALRDISRATGIHIVAATGLHRPSSYVRGHWLGRYDRQDLQRLFVDEIEVGIDRHDYVGPVIDRHEARAGVIKVAIDGDAPSPVESRILDAASGASRRTGAAVIAHTNGVASGRAIAEHLLATGLEADRLVLSHLDRDPDLAGIRSVLSLGVWAELDQAARDPGRAVAAVSDLLDAGFEAQLMLGMDMGRRRYWRHYGGEPGLDHLLTTFRDLLGRVGVSGPSLTRMFIANPARAFSLRGVA